MELLKIEILLDKVQLELIVDALRSAAFKSSQAGYKKTSDRERELAEYIENLSRLYSYY